MTTAALYRAERTPPQDRRLEGRIETGKQERSGDFGDFLKSSKEKEERKPKAGGEAAAQPEDPAGQQPPLAASQGIADSSLMAALLVALQSPVSPPPVPALKLSDATETEESGQDPSSPAGLAGATEGSSLDSVSAGLPGAASPAIAGQLSTKDLASKKDQLEVQTKAGSPSSVSKELRPKPEASAGQSKPALPLSASPKPDLAGQAKTAEPAAADSQIAKASSQPTESASLQLADLCDRAPRARTGPKEERNGEQPEDPLDQPSETSGTPAALTPIAMHNGFFQDGFAGGGKQDLPGRQSSASQHQGDLPAAAPASAPGAFTVGLFGGLQPPAEAASTVPAKSAQPDQVSLRLERIGELLHTECMLMRQVKPASLTAVLRPDAQTEIHLQLRFDRNGIEATCRCEKGDLQSLASGWTQLQNDLSQRGVRLLPIQGSNETSSGTGGWFQGSGEKESPRRDPQEKENLPVFWGASGGAGSNAGTRPAPSETGALPGTLRHMLESWA